MKAKIFLQNARDFFKKARTNLEELNVPTNTEKKITQKELIDLILNGLKSSVNGQLDIAALLSKAGYSNNLSGLAIKIPSEFAYKELSINLSGLNLQRATYINGFNQNHKVNFSNSNLDSATIGLFLNPGNEASAVNFTGANMKGCLLIGNENELNSTLKKQGVTENDFSILPLEKGFSQGYMIDTFNNHPARGALKELTSFGVCSTLTFEYMRYYLAKWAKSDIPPEGFLNKLQNKSDQLSKDEIEKPSFFARMDEYENRLMKSLYEAISFRKMYNANETQLRWESAAPNQLGERLGNGLLESIEREEQENQNANVTKVNRPQFIEISYGSGDSMDDGHAVLVRIVREPDNGSGKIKGYQFFDPNIGETPILDKDKLCKVIENSVNMYVKRGFNFKKVTFAVPAQSLINSLAKGGQSKEFSKFLDAVKNNKKDEVLERLNDGFELPNKRITQYFIEEALTHNANDSLKILLDKANPTHRLEILEDILRYNREITSKNYKIMQALCPELEYKPSKHGISFLRIIIKEGDLALLKEIQKNHPNLTKEGSPLYYNKNSTSKQLESTVVCKNIANAMLEGLKNRTPQSVEILNSVLNEGWLDKVGLTDDERNLYKVQNIIWSSLKNLFNSEPVGNGVFEIDADEDTLNLLKEYEKLGLKVERNQEGLMKVSVTGEIQEGAQWKDLSGFLETVDTLRPQYENTKRVATSL